LPSLCGPIVTVKAKFADQPGPLGLVIKQACCLAGNGNEVLLSLEGRDHEDKDMATVSRQGLVPKALCMENTEAPTVLHKFEVIGVVPFLVAISVFCRVPRYEFSSSRAQVAFVIPDHRLEEI
jgi:hypothetical protein